MERKYVYGVSILLLMLFSRMCLAQVLPNPECLDVIRTTGWCEGAKFCVIRYHFNIDENRCKPFAFHDLKMPGSRNFFKTKTACDEMCPPIDPALLTTTPPLTPEPTQATELPVLPPTTTTPPDTTPTEPMGDPCFVLPDPGPCNDYTTRWYYSTRTFRCEPFEYGGCYGNANNFGSFKECHFSCPKANECVAPVLAEPCKDRTYHWYYNATALECQQYRPTDCAISPNRFKTLRECQDKCNGCDQPKDSGGCRGFFQNWFYNATSRECDIFIYGGCFGNLNRFETPQDCVRDCVGQRIQ